MKTIILTIFIFIVSVQISISQTQFQRTVGGTGNDGVNSIIRTTDGSYAAAGNTTSFGAGLSDMYIVKLDASGSLLWSKTIGGTGNDYASSIIQTTDGGYAVSGYTNSFGAGSSDMYVVKLDAGGTVLWSKTVGGTGSEEAGSIVQTTDGGYAVIGSTNSFGAGSYDMYIVKLDAGGSLLWSKTVGGTGSEIAFNIIHTSDGGYAFIGGNYSTGARYVVKLDAGGTLQWSRLFTLVDFERIIQTSDGGYTVAGDAYTIGAGGFDFYIVKLDTGGTLQWSETIGGTSHEVVHSIIQTTDGGYAMVGNTNSFGAGGYDFYIVKLNATGNVEWNRTIGGTGDDRGIFIVRTTDGGYALAGNTNSFGAGGYDFYIVKLDGSGNTCGNTSTPSPSLSTGGTSGSITFTVTLPTSSVTSPSPLTGTGGTVTAICTLVGIQPVSNELPHQFSLSQNYPNPFNPGTVISFQLPVAGFVTLKIYNILGSEVATLVSEQLNAGTYEADWNATNEPTGVYYYKLTIGEFSETRKAVLIK